MRFTVITPSYNCGSYLEETICSVLDQREKGIQLEYIVVDGCSTDQTPDILNKYRKDINRLIIEPDTGPANAINKGLAAATGDILSWLGADDIYYPGSLKRVKEATGKNPEAQFYFGRCPIINDRGTEIRKGITRFKEFFFPLSSRFTFQCINYLSQPAVFFRQDALHRVGPLREDMVAAWDYEFFLRLWREGKAARISGEPLAAFRWHEQSISGSRFAVQFREEYEAARNDAGRLSLQTFLHFFVRWGIVGIYSAMSTFLKYRQYSWHQ
jgi:glycosyltransferase involved in cell wall biosynthesis